jgi:uncharacterized cofD-like protein
MGNEAKDPAANAPRRVSGSGAQAYYRSASSTSSRKRVVVIGGGTGSYSALMGLKRHDADLTAIVSMADNGGSSGVLRDEFGHLPPGDVRRCLLALSAEPAAGTLRRLFEYRFERGSWLNGHSFGNVLITALTEITGAPDLAIQEAANILNVKGRVLPVTLDNERLCARLEDGTVINGETHIDRRTIGAEVGIAEVWLTPQAKAYPPTVDAILSADILVIGPGDLYTSVIPNLLVEGVAEAIGHSHGYVVYVCNLMTKRAETDGYKASDFVAKIQRYLGSPGHLDQVIVNQAEAPEELLAHYRHEGSSPVEADLEACMRLGPWVVAPPLAASGTLWRHSSEELAGIVMGMAS